jgi:hypothetical protein
MFIYNCIETGNICMIVYSLGPEILYSYYMYYMYCIKLCKYFHLTSTVHLFSLYQLSSFFTT